MCEACRASAILALYSADGKGGSHIELVSRDGQVVAVPMLSPSVAQEYALAINGVAVALVGHPEFHAWAERAAKGLAADAAGSKPN